MKNILLTLFTVFTVNLFAGNGEPKLTLEVYIKNPSDTSVISSLKKDVEFCCYFDVVACPSDTITDVSIIRCSETGIALGKIYGTPSKEFLINLSKNYLTPEKVKAMVTRIKQSEKQNFSVKE